MIDVVIENYGQCTAIEIRSSYLTVLMQRGAVHYDEHQEMYFFSKSHTYSFADLMMIMDIDVEIASPA